MTVENLHFAGGLAINFQLMRVQYLKLSLVDLHIKPIDSPPAKCKFSTVTCISGGFFLVIRANT